jgi:hypothetical protein
MCWQLSLYSNVFTFDILPWIYVMWLCFICVWIVIIKVWINKWRFWEDLSSVVYASKCKPLKRWHKFGLQLDCGNVIDEEENEVSGTEAINKSQLEFYKELFNCSCNIKPECKRILHEDILLKELTRGLKNSWKITKALDLIELYCWILQNLLDQT